MSITINSLIDEYKNGKRDFSGEQIVFDYAIYDEDLRNLNLSYCDLSSAIFVGVNLSRANLSYANLSNASLRQVNLEKANLEGTNFVGASLEDTNMIGAVYDPNKTYFPLGYDPVALGAIALETKKPNLPETPSEIIPSVIGNNVQDINTKEPDPSLISEPTQVSSTIPLESITVPQAITPASPASSITVTPAPAKPSITTAVAIFFGIVTGSVLISLVLIIAQQGTLIRSNSPVQQSNQVTSASAPPSPTPKPTLTQAEALAILNQWLEAKQVIFGPSYDTSPAYELSTGPFLNEIITDSVPWLRNNDAYYTYTNQSVSTRGYFRSDNGVTEIDVNVAESLKYYRNGRLRKPQTYNKPYRYTLIYESGQWKISRRVDLS